MTKRIGVIGAGISGLSVAHLLSQKGYVVDIFEKESRLGGCLLYTSPSPRDRTRSRMPSSA